ncbi:MAG TPA: beta-ketoacyl synthase N-terminal-like domain-containing protein [Kofleriaceae bacterium]
MNDPGAGPAIAIVGWACRFPGASSPEALWQLLATGADPIGVVPPNRWDADALYAPAPRTPGKMNTRWGGFLDDVDAFDAEFFGMQPREACAIDPQQRIALEVAWSALEDAGIVPARLAGTSVGVFFGASNWDYNNILNRDIAVAEEHSGPGTALSVISNRVSFALDLKGPSITVDTACSSALVALHWACHSLRTRESSLALVGGVNLILSPETSIVLSQGRALSSVGRSRTFDEGADGFVRSEGCAVLVVKRLDQAEADGDRILGVVRGTAVNHNGASYGLAAPYGPAQEALLRQTLAQAGVVPNELSFVEAHGTGTALGDLIELRALRTVLLEGRSPQQRCAIASIKSNIGHTEAASGLAGMIRVLLSMQHGVITPNLHLQKLSPHIATAIDGTPLFIPTQAEPWTVAGRRLAAVSSFSFGGANAQVILEQARGPAAAPDRSSPPSPHALMLSARSTEGLRELARSYAAYLTAHPSTALVDVCFTANTARSQFDHQLCAVSTSVDRLGRQLSDFAAGRPAEGLWAGQRSGRKRPTIVLQLRGAGPTPPHTSMRRLVERCAPLLPAPLLCQVSLSAEQGEPLSPSAYRAVHVAVQLTVARQWMAWGLRPTAVTGDGVGEIAAACVRGSMTTEEAWRYVLSDGELPRPVPPAPFERAGKLMCLAISSDTETLSVEDPSGEPRVLVRGELIDGERQTHFHCLANLAVHGADIDWRAVYSEFPAQRIALPTYPFQRQRYWMAAGSAAPAPAGRDSGGRASNLL